jgi:hypothetical protein
MLSSDFGRTPDAELGIGIYGSASGVLTVAGDFFVIFDSGSARIWVADSRAGDFVLDCCERVVALGGAAS